MSYTIIFLVILCTIIVLFSEDFAKVGKKIFAIKGMKLLLPIFAVSAVIIDYFSFFIWILDLLVNGLAIIKGELASLIPFGNFSPSIAMIMLLMTVVLILGPLMTFILRLTGHRPFIYRQQLLLVVWAVMAVLNVFILNPIGQL